MRIDGVDHVIGQMHAHVVDQVAIVGFDAQAHALHLDAHSIHVSLLGCASGA